MGSDRHTNRRWRPLRAFALLGCGALVATGCASMPDSGEVHRVDASQRADADAQVRVFGVPPRSGEQPNEIVKGFLEATTSDEVDFKTARLYLTKEASKNWKPFSRTTVLQDGPIPRTDVPAGEQAARGEGATAELSGKQVATVDQKQAYTPGGGAYRTTIHLTKVGGEWRIDVPPDGLVLGKADFERIYRSVNKYYFARTDPDEKAAGAQKEVLVADPVYLRRRIDPLTSTVNALLQGPTQWLSRVVGTTFPRGTAVVDDTLSLDDSNGLRVRLNDRAARVAAPQCDRMAAQLLYTVQDQASAKISRVELARKDGSELCVLKPGEAAAYAPAGLRTHSEHQYFVDSEHRLASLSDGSDEPSRVEGPFGDGSVQLGAVGVDRSERFAAGVSLDGRSLYVAPMSSGAEQGEARLHSSAKRERDALTAPSWDGNGNLWVADRDPDRPRLLRLSAGTGKPEEVEVPALGDGRIEGLRVSSDGVRIALLVTRDGHTSLELGRVERTETRGGEVSLLVRDLRSVAPQLQHVKAASWAGSSRLVVVGTEAGGVQQLQYVETDGSSSNTPTLPGINDVRAVAASEDKNKPLMAHSSDGIVRLPLDANWKLVTRKGSAPVYPG
ncbi:LpqB family beta-propeller domain-containing protein [Streptomyces sp. NPDC001922]|uniref:LpqB family beta-propeller domain-containing protein n=1 Tax=Streptomyces sp. NPDC001922 TaxID=3364624 RepID=UPI0036984A07